MSLKGFAVELVTLYNHLPTSLLVMILTLSSAASYREVNAGCLYGLRVTILVEQIPLEVKVSETISFRSFRLRS